MKRLLFTLIVIMSSTAIAKKNPDQKFWTQKSEEPFSDSEENFKIAMQKLLSKYIDRNITQEALYRAATAGMLAHLNPGQDEDEEWNTLLSPSDLRETQIELSGKVTGIGVEIEFDKKTGYARILGLIPGSVAERGGLKVDDQILSVDGKTFKNKKFRDVVQAIRGNADESISMKILREDQIVSFKLKREVVRWTPVDLETVNSTTALLSIGFFNEDTPKFVEDKLNEFKSKKYTNLIIDVRNNSGGGFEQSVRVAEFFLPVGSVVASTKTRDGKIEKYTSHHNLLESGVQVVVLTNKNTFCGAELFAASLRENIKAKIVGETTYGKWNAQSVEALPNRFAIKYTVKELLSPLGNSFHQVGVKPDVEASFSNGTSAGLGESVGPRELKLKYRMKDRINADSQLRAALELMRTTN